MDFETKNQKTEEQKTEEQKKKEQQRLIQFKQDTGLKSVDFKVDEVKETNDLKTKNQEGILEKARTLTLNDIAVEIAADHLKKNKQGIVLEDKNTDKSAAWNMIEEMTGFETLDWGTVSEEELSRQALKAREDKADEYEIPPCLYQSTEEQKDRILKSMKLDKVVKDRVIREKKSLEEIIHTHVEKEEQIRAAKEGKRFLNVFQTAKEELNNNPLLTGRERLERLYRLAKPYEYCIEMYKEEYFVTLDKTSREDNIEKLLEKITNFYNYFADGIGDMTDEKLVLVNKLEIKFDREESVLEKIDDTAHKIDKSVAFNPNTSMDESLTSEQRAGIMAIDRFLIEQSGTSGGNLEFIDKLLTLSMRDRLMIYGLVEKKREQAPNPEDIAYTQLCYVPNVIAFQSAVSFLPKFMWGGDNRNAISRHITNLKWGKLESALDVLKQDNAVQIRDAYASFAIGDDTPSIEETRTMGKKAETEDERAAQKLLDELDEKEKARDAQFDVVIKALMEARDALETAENAKIKKKAKKDTAEQKSKAAKSELEKLEDLDRELYITVDGIRKMAGDEASTAEGILPDGQLEEKKKGKIKGKDPGKGIIAKATGASILATSQGSLLLSKMDKIATIANGEASTGISYAAGAFTTITGLVGLIGGVMGAKDLVAKLRKKGNQIAYLDIANMITQSAKGIGGSAWGAFAGLYQIGLVKAGEMAVKKAAEGAAEAAKTMKDNIGIATNAITYANVAVSGAKILMDAYDGAVQIKHAVHLGVAAYRVNHLEKKGELKGVDALYADNILKLEKRSKEREAVNTLNSIAVNSAGIVATLLGGPVGAVAFGVGSIVNTFVMKGFNSVLKKLERKAMVDEFLQIEGLAPKMIPGYDKMSFFAKRSARQRLKEHIMAELGYVSEKALSAHIIGNYAKFIYNKLFFVNDDPQRPLLKKNDKDHTLTDISMTCFQMVKSLGLRVTFPEDKDGERYPTPEMIAAKLSA